MTFSRSTSWTKSTLLYVNSVAELKSLPISSANRNIVYLRGYYSLFDGGEGYLRFDPFNRSTDIDDGIYFSPAFNPLGTQGAWQRIFNSDEPINLRWFGAKGNASFYNSSDQKYYSDQSFTHLATDDSVALQKMRNYQMKNKKYDCYIPRGNYLLSDLDQAVLSDRWRHRFNMKGESSDSTVFILSNHFIISSGTGNLQETGFADPSIHAWRETIDLRGYGSHSNNASYNTSTKQLTIKSDSVNFNPSKNYANYWVIVRGDFGNKLAYAQAIIESGVNNGNGTYTFTFGKVLTDNYLVNPKDYWVSPITAVSYTVADNGSTQSLTLGTNQRLVDPTSGTAPYNNNSSGIPAWSAFQFSLCYDMLVTSLDGTRGGYVHITTPDVRTIYETNSTQRTVILDKSLGLLNSSENIKVTIKSMLYIGLELVNTNKLPTNPSKFKVGDWVLVGLGSAPYDMDGNFETFVTKINKIEGNFAYIDDHIKRISHPVSTFISRLRPVEQTANTFKFTYSHNAMMRIEDKSPGFEPQFSFENIQFKRHESLPLSTTAPAFFISQRRFFELKKCRFTEISVILTNVTDGYFEEVAVRKTNVPTFTTNVVEGFAWERITFKRCELVGRTPERRAGERSVKGGNIAACEIKAADILFDECLLEGGCPNDPFISIPGEAFRSFAEFFNASNIVFNKCNIRAFGSHFGVSEFRDCTILPGTRLFSTNYEFASIFDSKFTGKLFTPVKPIRFETTPDGATDVCSDAGFVGERPEKICEFSVKEESTLFSGGNPLQFVKLPARFDGIHYYKVEWQFVLKQAGTFPYGCRFYILCGVRPGQDSFDSQVDESSIVDLQDNKRIAYYNVISNASYFFRRGLITNANATHFFRIISFTDETLFFDTVSDIRFKLYGRDFSADL